MDRSSQQIFLLFVLLAFYALGPLIILVWTLTSINYASGKVENDTLLDIVTTLASTPGAYTGVLHQMIVPVVAAVIVASFKTILGHTLARWLFIVPLLTIFICLVDALLFSSLLPRDIAGLDVGGVPAAGALSQLFLTTATTLATYVMVLVGLQAAGSTGCTDTGSSTTGQVETPEDEERGSIAWGQQATNRTDETTYPGSG